MAVDETRHTVAVGGGELLSWRGPAQGGVEILVDPVLTGETALCVLTQTLDPGAMVPVHHHEKAEQVLYVLAGRGRISLGGRDIEAEPGVTVHVPKRAAHGIFNTTNEPLTYLEVTSPPGFQEIFREMDRIGEPSIVDVVRIGARHDVVMHPPDRAPDRD